MDISPKKIYEEATNEKRCPTFLEVKVEIKVVQSCQTLCDPMDYTVHRILHDRILEWVASSLLQGIFPTQGSNPGLPYCRRILYQLSPPGKPW